MIENIINTGMNICTCINDIGLGINVGEKYYYDITSDKSAIILINGSISIPMNKNYFKENFKTE